jgi:hypothetical protein
MIADALGSLAPSGGFAADLWVTRWLTHSLGVLIVAPTRATEWAAVPGATIAAAVLIFAQPARWEKARCSP